MTISEFDSLNLKEQAKITWENGIIEDNRANEDYHYILYKVHDFFVEIAFHPESEEIVQIRSFT